MNKFQIVSAFLKKQRKSLQSRNINSKALTRAVVLLIVFLLYPMAAQAEMENSKSIEPLSAEQAEKLNKEVVSLIPDGSIVEKPDQVKIEIKPEPAPEPPAPEPAPPAPSPRPARIATRQTARRATARRAISSRSNTSGTSWEQCIPYARRISGVQVRGYAGDVQPNSSEASVGSVALFAGYGHAAVVTGVNGDSVTIKEANYVPGKITERTVPKSQLRGYVK